MGGLPVALWQLHSVETGRESGRWHPHVSCLPDTVNIVVLCPVITGTGLHQECLYIKIVALGMKTCLQTSH